MIESRGGDWPTALIFLLGFVYLFLAMFAPLDLFDEGIIVVAAERILHGAVPYRDFAAYYTPGQFYTVAAVFHFFGSSILTERVWNTMVRFLVCVLVFLVARTLTTKRASYVPFLITVLYFGWCGFFGYPVVPAMLWALVAILLLIRTWPQNRPRSLLLAGLAVGLSAFYRQDVGAYAFLSCAAALLAAAFVMPQDMDPVRSGIIRRLQPLGIYCLGTCLVAGPLLGYFLWRIPFGELWADFMKLPRLQLQFRYIPLPPIIPGGAYLLSSMVLQRVWFLFYVPVILYVLATVGLVRRISRPRVGLEARRQSFAVLLLALFGLMLLVTTATRADPIHCLALTVPAAILFVPQLREWRCRRKPATLFLAICLAVLAVPYLLSPVVRWSLDLRAFAPWTRTSSLARARFFHVPADQAMAVRFIQKHVSMNQDIFVANTRQRRVVGNDVMFYFLADRRPGTHYEEFEPGVVTTAPVQRKMVRELQENDVGYVVLFSGYETRLRTMSSSVEGSEVLDRFLRREYEGVAKFGQYSMLERREDRGRPVP